ncbi:MAG: flagellar biosynthesis protein FlhA [Lentisphaerae bacterium RIFOXYB12_FULL_65_16]|nr:MAG: flagellar biosynthesis protein FlhA [Lentisphaerae bacterium RIFOXYA12_64_32]OGV88893.1 MAG: flagellar biosynthesis protein FlhA [Lentisphaerae bacterium RIFOXYB12_FULL_65_16]
MNETRRTWNPEVFLALIVGGILVVLLVPLPALLLDLLLVLNIGLTLSLLVMMFYLRSPLEFSSFPALLLMVTLFRLSLNVAATKLILLNGFGGHVINAFGQFVVGNNYVVGAVMFLILLVIQFVVITKGATRIAEVAARFTLDAMPGKQMSIDADLNAGIIDEDEARGRREKLSHEADFFGSMDGASKFVRGDAVAALVITAINILGGLAIGVLQRGMTIVDALQTYTLLTIGEGLVAQIPALIVSLSAGILVTKAATTEGLGTHISGQLLRRPEPLMLSGVMLLGLGLLPGLPLLPFAVLAGGAMWLSTSVRRRQHLASQAAGGAAGELPGTAASQLGGAGKAKQLAGAAPGTAPGVAPGTDKQPALLSTVSPLVLEIGFGLIPLVDQRLDGDLVTRLGKIREQIRDDLGILIPPISVQDNIQLANSQYRVLIRGMERGRGTVQVGSHLAINPGDVSGQLEGVRTTEPAFGLEAVWIDSKRVAAAETRGYTVVDCPSVVATHLAKIVRENVIEVLSRQSVSDMVDRVKETDATVVSELVPQQLNIGGVHRVLQCLLSEQVPIHDLATVLETLSDYAGHTKDPLLLSEFCRQAVKARIVARHLGDDGSLRAFILTPDLEDGLQQSLSRGKTGALSLSPEQADALVNEIRKEFGRLRDRADAAPVLIVAPAIRPHLARLVHRKTPDLAVLSYAEVPDDVRLQVLGTVDAPMAKEALAA